MLLTSHDDAGRRPNQAVSSAMVSGPFDMICKLWSLVKKAFWPWCLVSNLPIGPAGNNHPLS